MATVYKQRSETLNKVARSIPKNQEKDDGGDNSQICRQNRVVRSTLRGFACGAGARIMHIAAKG